MNPFTRLAASLVLALAMWTPALLSLLRGSMDILLAGLFFVGALAIAYIGTGIVGSIINGYEREQRMNLQRARRVQREIEALEAAEARKAEAHNRRANDEQ